MVTFRQVGGSRFYVFGQYAGNIASARVGFVLNAGLPLPQDLDPGARLGQGTICLFPTLSAGAAATFPTSAPGMLDANGADKIRLALFSADGALRAASELVRGGADGVLTQDAELFLGVKNDSPPTGDGTWSSVLRTGAKMVAAGDRIEFQFPAGATKLGFRMGGGTQLIPLPGGHRRYELMLTGSDRGLFRFPGEVDPAGAESLGLGMRYFRLEALNPKRARVVPHHYPLLDIGTKAQFDLALDFAAPLELEKVGGLDRPRTMLYPPSDPLRSNLHAVHGQIVTLSRLSSTPDIGFRLTKSPKVLAVDGSGKLIEVGHYFTPHGQFSVAREDAPKQSLRLALGLSNLESLRIEPSAGDHLVFEQGAALVEGGGASFLEGDVDLDVANGHCLTAWTRLVREDASLNAATSLALDPEGMPGYRVEAGSEMPFSPTRFEAPSDAFPMVPLLGLARSSAPGAKPQARLGLERDVLARARRGLLTTQKSLRAAMTTASRLSPEQARTPHGYLAERAGATTWTRVTFGRTSKEREGTNATKSGVASFGLVATTPQTELNLAEALAGNRLFLVTRPAQLRRLKFDDHHFEKLFMSGWEATLDDDAIIILKHDDRSVADVFGDVKNWTARATFLPDDNDTTKIQSAITKAIADNRDLYKPLQRRLKDPNWNGALVLDAKLLKSGLPDQLLALTPSLPDLRIHHVGIDISAITGMVEADKTWPTAVFAVVDYDGSGEKFAADSGLSMRVSRLVLRVENDCIDRFECVVQLKLAGLFDVAAQAPDKILTLQGSYESRVDKEGRRQDSYRFVAERDGGGALFEHDFAAPSLIEKVRLDRVELLTITAAGSPPIGRYLIDGDIKFGKISDLDLLGIDALKFSGFGIEFDLHPLKFAARFQYPSMRFDFEGLNRGAIKRRAGSFLSKFPIKLRGFRVGEFQLPKLGYFNFGEITLPDGFKASSDFKFGFDFDLDLGSLGALAKKLDRFKLQIVIGWKPPELGANLDTLFAFGFRLDLGEGAGGIDLGLQGILRLTAERFNLKKVKHPNPAKGDVIVLSADNCVLEILGQRLPTQEDQRFSLFLFGEIGEGLFERPGWYASFIDKSPTKPIAIDRLTMGQRVNVKFDELSSTKAAIAWLDKQESFGPGEEKKFVDFAGGGQVLQYDPNRDWFLAARGDFFSVARVALLLRDPDLYGAYLGILGTDQAPIFELDLLYEKLADGVGRYSIEVMLPPDLRTVELGVFSLTIGVLRAEVYTNGGFLFDAGMPKHVDYSRSFVVQGGPFIGKGGIYIGRVPREAVPIMDGLQIGDVFRSGVALRVGLGREFEKGPIRAGLSVSVFGRFEGAIARLKDGSSYAVALQGEVGIIAEIEGSVDLRLIRVRLFIRVWVAAGVTLVTGKPVVLYCEAGVEVSIQFVIGRIRIFGRSITISITLSYHTQLRYEWELPATMPPIGLLPAATQADPGPWTLPDFAKLGVAAAPFELRLAFDGARICDGGAPEGRAVPSIIWLADDAMNKGRGPYAEIGRALLGWSALRLSPAAPSADKIILTRSDPMPGEIAFSRLQQDLKTFDDVDPVVLDGVFQTLFSHSKLGVVKDTSNGAGYAFPVPPGLKLTIGGTLVDFDKIGLMTDDEANALMAHLDGQFAELPPQTKLASAAGSIAKPLVQRLFQEWCQLLALTTLDVLNQSLGTDEPAATLETLWSRISWEEIAARAGRLFHSGARVPAGGKFEPLLAKAGLLLAIPKGAKPSVTISGAASWLDLNAETLDLDGAAVERLGAPAPKITRKLTEAPAVRLAARGFVLPGFARLIGDDGKAKGVLAELGSDLGHQLALSITDALPAELDFFARKAQAKGQGKIEEELLTNRPARCLVFNMAIERIPVNTNSSNEPAFLPDSFQIAGASEVERIGLDALLRGDEAEVAARLKGSRLYIAVKVTEKDGHATILRLDAVPAEVRLARATVSLERRPFDTSALHAAAAPEDTYCATLVPNDRLDFLLLLQRAAIVNSGGTYLLVPSIVGKTIGDIFKLEKRIELSFILEYADTAPAISAATNAVLISDVADVAKLDPPGAHKMLATRLSTTADLEACAKTTPGLVETVSLRAPGTELLRVWRKAPRQVPDTAPIDQQIEAHLDNLFDMLEFQVEDDKGNVLLGFDEALPLPSERAVAGKSPDQIKAWLLEEARQAGFDAQDQRYDLILPLAALVTRTGGGKGAYAGVGQEFVVRTGWRDLYGNRLHAEGDIQKIQLKYRDPIVPLESWPGVVASFSPGAASSRTLDVIFDADLSAFGQGPNLLAAQGLKRVIDQLSAPGVSGRLDTSLGAPSDPALPLAKLISHLSAIAKALEGGTGAPAALRFPIKLPSLASQPFLPIDMQLTIERASTLVAETLASGVAKIVCPLSSSVAASGGAPGAASKFAAAFQDAFKPAGKPAPYLVAHGALDTGASAWWAVDVRVLPVNDGSKPTGFAPPPPSACHFERRG